MSEGTETSVKTYLIWTVKIVLAILGVITIHYIGYFSMFSGDYFSLISASLSKRVVWELVSALSFTSLFVALLFLVLGLLKSMWLGGKTLLNQTPNEESEERRFRSGPVTAGYAGVLAVIYVPYDFSVFDKTVYLLIILFVMAVIYAICFHEYKEATKWSQFVAPFRQKELAISASIAVILLVPFLMGKGLAWSVLNAEPKTLFTKNGEIQVIVLDITDTYLLIKNDIGLELLPLHQVQKIVW